MKSPYQAIMRVLDRPPKAVRGQSLVELTMTMPILLIMLLGLVEVGWLANNYLILIDVSREAGRYGSVRDPLVNWIAGDELNYQRKDCDSEIATFNKVDATVYTTYPGPPMPDHYYGNEGLLDYYDGVACAVLANMVPLEFRDDMDDIVVSVVSYVVVDTGSGPRAVITGRFPPRSNECADDGRDPFAPSFLPAGMRDPIGYDAGVEGRRGYFFRGNHVTAEGCRGSEFSLPELENIINRTMLDDTGNVITNIEAESIPNNALVIVEIHWIHEQLLGLPFFTWIGNPVPLNVWTIFPASAAEPTATPRP